MTLKTEEVMVNIGPQHPSTHGVFRMRVTFDGEVVTDLEPVFGYLHRGTEKLAEERTYTQIITLTDRLDYLASMSNNLAYVLAAEKLAGIEPPERAMYIRVIMAELMRIASHCMALGFFINDLGALATPLMYMFREREKILDLFEMVCGARITYSYMRIGGVSGDLPPEFTPALIKFINEMPGYIDEYEALLRENEIIISRTKDMAILPPDTAINASVSGPMLRASGVNWDLRKADPYEVYDRFEFDVPVGPTGDTYDRFLVRLGGDAGERPNRQAGYGADTGRAVQGQGAVADSSAQGRGLRARRGAEGGARVLSGERRGDISVPVQDTGTVLH